MRQIPLTQNQTTIVDDIDSDLDQWKWNEHKGYVRSRMDGQRTHISMHRIILARKLGRELLPTEKVDHEDGNGLNNRRSNLRLATTTQNNRNRGLQAHNTSGFKGVNWDERLQKYRAKITVNRKCIHLGMFDTAQEAADAYDGAACLCHGRFAKLNSEIEKATG